MDRTSKTLLRLIRKAPAVFVGAGLGTEDVEYFQVSKAEATYRVTEFAKNCPTAEGTYRFRLSEDEGYLFIG